MVKRELLKKAIINIDEMTVLLKREIELYNKMKQHLEYKLEKGEK